MPDKSGLDNQQINDIQTIGHNDVQSMVSSAKRKQRSATALNPATATHGAKQKPSQLLKQRKPQTTNPAIVKRKKAPAAITRTVAPSRLELAAQKQSVHPAVSKVSTANTAERKVLRPVAKTESPSAERLQKQIDSYLADDHVAANASQPLESKGRLLSLKRAIALGFVLLALTGAGFAYSNRDVVYFKIAGNSAGIEAQPPGYKPSGYVLSESIKYNPGTLTATYESTTSDRSYELTQTKTTWDSQALYDNYVNVAFPEDNQTIRKSGLSLYLYGEGNIAWINGGTWYEVKSDNALSPEQLVGIAISL